MESAGGQVVYGIQVDMALSWYSHEAERNANLPLSASAITVTSRLHRLQRGCLPHSKELRGTGADT